MKSHFWTGILIIVLITALFFIARPASNSSSSLTSVSANDHIKGYASSSVIFIEYSDFECPACRNYYFVLRQIMVEFGDQVAFVFRNFPLSEIHEKAIIAARAAEAAGKQNKFWEMHDLLFEKQEEWSKASDPEKMFISYATLLGISVERFRSDLNSKEVVDFVNKQRKEAIKLGLQGTPSFFINGEKIDNPRSVEDFRVIIKGFLDKK